MNCTKGCKEKMEVCGIDFICRDCHIISKGNAFINLSIAELEQIKKECDCWISHIRNTSHIER